MTVKELINILNSLPQDELVVIYDIGDNVDLDIQSIEHEENTIKYKPSKLVVIRVAV